MNKRLSEDVTSWTLNYCSSINISELVNKFSIFQLKRQK